MRISTENFIRSIYSQRFYAVSRDPGALAQNSFVFNYCPLVERDPMEKQKSSKWYFIDKSLYSMFTAARFVREWDLWCSKKIIDGTCRHRFACRNGGYRRSPLPNSLTVWLLLMLFKYFAWFGNFVKAVMLKLKTHSIRILFKTHKIILFVVTLIHEALRELKFQRENELWQINVLAFKC